MYFGGEKEQHDRPRGGDRILDTIEAAPTLYTEVVHVHDEELLDLHVSKLTRMSGIFEENVD